LTDAIFATDSRSDANTVRQSLLLEYANRLAAMVSGSKKATNDYLSQSMALQHLDPLRRRLVGKTG